MRTAACLALLASIAFAQSQDDKPDQLFRNAVDAQQRGNLTAAIQDYEHLLRLRPNAVDAWANLGAALAHLGRFDEAIEKYRSALNLDPNNPDIQLNLALAYYKKGDFQSALHLFAPLAHAQPANLRLVILLGNCYLQIGDNNHAIALLLPFEAAHSEDLDLSYALGSALIRAGREHEGVPLIERVARQGHSADAYLLAGSTLLKLGESTQALHDLQAALNLNPNLPRIYTLSGMARESNGDDTGAETDLRKALQQNPDDFDANIHLGGILYLRRDLPAAKPYLEHALALNPSSTFAIYEMALWKSASGQMDAAVADLEKVERADPNWLEPHVKLAALYYRVRRPADGERERQIVDRISAQKQKQVPSQAARP